MPNSSALFLAGKEVVLLIWYAKNRDLLLFLPDTQEAHPVEEYNAKDIKQVFLGDLEQELFSSSGSVAKNIAEVVFTRFNWVNTDLINLAVLNREDVMALVPGHHLKNSLSKYERYAVMSFFSRSEHNEDLVIFWPERVHLRLEKDTSYILLEKRR